MRRGTTPEITFTLDTGMNLSLVPILYVTIKQDSEIVTYEKSDLTVDGNKIILKLTQADTLKFCEGHVYMQIRGKTDAGDAFATSIAKVRIDRILKEGEI